MKVAILAHFFSFATMDYVQLRAESPAPLDFMQPLPISPGFAGRSSRKTEIFSKNRGLAGFVEASAFA
jgi:hypothetical protein